MFLNPPKPDPPAAGSFGFSDLVNFGGPDSPSFLGGASALLKLPLTNPVSGASSSFLGPLVNVGLPDFSSSAGAACLGLSDLLINPSPNPPAPAPEGLSPLGFSGDPLVGEGLRVPLPHPISS